MKYIVTILIALFLSSLSSSVFAANIHIRQSDDCENNGDGSTWECAAGAGAAGAFDGFPSTLVRGNTYYVADGTYSGQTVLDDAVSGSTWIYIKKATATSHGLETGWDSALGDGQAIFTWTGGTTTGNVFTVKTSYFDIDGQSGGYPTWTSGHGFKITTDNPKATLFCITHNGTGTAVAGYVHLHRVELSHTGRATNPDATGGYGCLVMGTQAATGGTYSAGNNEFSYNHIHDSPVMLAWGYKTGSFIFEYNYLDTSAAFESGSSVQGSGITTYGGQSQIYRYNVFKDIKGSCGVCLYTWHGTMDVDNISFYGNRFFYTPAFKAETGSFVQNGWVATDSDTSGGTYHASSILVYNNTFADLRGYKMFWIPSTNTGSGNVIQNNVLYQNRGVSLANGDFNGFAHSYNWFYGNVAYNSLTTNLDSSWSGGEAGTGQIGSGSPFIDVSNYVYDLSAATNAGYTLDSSYLTDAYKNCRGCDGNIDRGAYEFTANDDTTSPERPQNLKLVEE